MRFKKYLLQKYVVLCFECVYFILCVTATHYLKLLATSYHRCVTLSLLLEMLEQESLWSGKLSTKPIRYRK